MYLYKLLFIILFVSTSVIFPKSFFEKPRKSYPGFSLDIPRSWLYTRQKKVNGIIINFTNPIKYPNVVVEVRSFSINDRISIKKLVSQKAARLVAEYSQIDILEKRYSRLSKNMYYSLWKLKENYKYYLEQSIFLIKGSSVLVVSCTALEEDFKNHKVLFENIFLSAKLILINKSSNNTSSFAPVVESKNEVKIKK